MTAEKPPLHSTFTPSRGLKVVDFVCRKMQRQMARDVSLGGSWFKLFKRYDRDSSGMLDFGEMEHVLRKEVKIRKTEVSDDELRLLWAVFDADGSGYVTIKEFSGFMRRYQHFGKSSFTGKVPITPMANVKDLASTIMESGRAMMKENDLLNIDDLEAHYRGTDYEEFAAWLSKNHESYDNDGNGHINMEELEVAVHEFQLQMERDRARMQASKPAVTAGLGGGMMAHSTSLPNLGTTYGSEMSMGLVPPGGVPIKGYRTIAGYSSIKREGPIMGNIPLRASDWVDVAEKLRIDFESKKDMRDRYEDTTFTGAPATSLTKLPLASYKAGAHMHNYVRTKWGGWRSRNDKPKLIKNAILPPEERKFLEQVRESHKPAMWPEPLPGDLHWCQRLDRVPTMSKLIATQNKYETLVQKMKHI